MSKFSSALNEQIAYEFGASQQYVAIAVHYDAQTLPAARRALLPPGGRGAEPRDDDGAVPARRGRGRSRSPPSRRRRSSSRTSSRPSQLALDQEKRVTGQIQQLALTAREEGDLVAEQFLHWFLQEQREEVSSMSALLDVVDALEGQRHARRGLPRPRVRRREPARGRCAACRGRRALTPVRTLTVRTERQSQLVDITRARRGTPSPAQTGAAVLVYVPHTTAGVTINEHADPMVARDFEMALERIVPEDWGWQHVEEGEENAPTHIRAALMGPSVVVPLRDDGVARARHLAGHLLLRVRRAARAVRARQRAALDAWGHGPLSGSTRLTPDRRAPSNRSSRGYPRRDGRARFARARSSRCASTRSPTAATASGAVDGFVVFVRGGLPGDLVRARATKVKRGFAEAIRTALLEPGPDRVEAPCRHFGTCGGCRFQDYAYEQPARRRRSSRCATRSRGSAASPSRRSSRSCPRARSYGYRNKLEYSFATGPDGPRARLPSRGPLGRGASTSRSASSRRTVGNAIREAVKEWARERGARAVRPGHADRLPAPSRRARGAKHGAGARPARHRAGRALRRGLPRSRRSRASRRCARSTGRSTTSRPR